MRYDAWKFLEELFNPKTITVEADLPAPDPARPDLTPDDLSSDWRAEYEERAAIREYDGNMTRELAEHYALLEIIEMMKTRA